MDIEFPIVPLPYFLSQIDFIRDIHYHPLPFLVQLLILRIGFILINVLTHFENKKKGKIDTKAWSRTIIGTLIALMIGVFYILFGFYFFAPLIFVSLLLLIIYISDRIALFIGRRIVTEGQIRWGLFFAEGDSLYTYAKTSGFLSYIDLEKGIGSISTSWVQKYYWLASYSQVQPIGAIPENGVVDALVFTWTSEDSQNHSFGEDEGRRIIQFKIKELPSQNETTQTSVDN